MFVELEERQMVFEGRLRNNFRCKWYGFWSITMLIPLAKVNVVCINPVIHFHHKDVMISMSISDVHMQGLTVAMIVHD